MKKRRRLLRGEELFKSWDESKWLAFFGTFRQQKFCRENSIMLFSGSLKHSIESMMVDNHPVFTEKDDFEYGG